MGSWKILNMCPIDVSDQEKAADKSQTPFCLERQNGDRRFALR